jgi:hypothetical protein
MKAIFWLSGACVLVLALQVASVHAATTQVYRVTNSGTPGDIFRYDGVDDFVSNTPAYSQSSPNSSYQNDGWFQINDVIYRTTGDGSIFQYDSADDFLTDTKGNGGAALATVGSYADDEWFVYDTNGTGGDQIIRVSNGNTVSVYDSVSAFIADSSSSSFTAPGPYDDDGYFAADGTIYRMGNGAGDIITYASWSDFTSNNGTTIGTVSGYANDGFFAMQAVPEPTTFSLLVLGGVALLCRKRKEIARSLARRVGHRE